LYIQYFDEAIHFFAISVSYDRFHFLMMALKEATRSLALQRDTKRLARARAQLLEKPILNAQRGCGVTGSATAAVLNLTREARILQRPVRAHVPKRRETRHAIEVTGSIGKTETTPDAHDAQLTRVLRAAYWIAFVCIAFALLWLAKQPAALETSAAPASVPALAPAATVPDFRSLDARDRKAIFFEFMRPLAAAVIDDVERERESVRTIAARVEAGKALSRAERDNLVQLARDYGLNADADASTASDAPRSPALPVTDVLRELALRVDTIPTSLLLVQAAKESGWGTSRFAIEGNSFFGERCYRPGCGIAPAALKNPRFNVERFASVTDSVRSYVRNINTHPRYGEFRALRRELRERGEDLDGIALAATLDAYSERGQAYVSEIASLIAQTGLPANE
jgi:Bax protein